MLILDKNKYKMLGQTSREFPHTERRGKAYINVRLQRIFELQPNKVFLFISICGTLENPSVFCSS